MLAFWQALLLIALAEMGDKTQLVALSFATRYRPLVVLAGVTVATLLVHLVSVVLGELLGLALPTFWLQLTAGLAFIVFGLWTTRGDNGPAKAKEAGRLGPLMTVALTFFLAELGDKTMLATVTIASQQGQFVPVWLGSTLGMVLADGLAIGLGVLAGRQLPERLVRYVAAAIFLTVGLWLLAGLFSRPGS